MTQTCSLFDEGSRRGLSYSGVYALKALRCHGMCDGALKGVYRAVVIARLLYASPAWWGYALSLIHI